MFTYTTLRKCMPFKFLSVIFHKISKNRYIQKHNTNINKSMLEILTLYGVLIEISRSFEILIIRKYSITA